MAKNHDSEANFRAKKSLSSIHEAREAADEAVDDLLMAHQHNLKQDTMSDRQQDLHVAVMMFYNRIRPYLAHVPELAKTKTLLLETDENGQPKTQQVRDGNGGIEEKHVGIFGLRSLDEWRLANTTVQNSTPVLGGEDEVEEREHPIHMPTEVALNAYDALNEALVQLEFGAEPGSDVPVGSLDDAPDDVSGEFPEVGEPGPGTAASDTGGEPADD
ncbi:hypothetical protein [Haloarchaeobius sp. DFWS5]|uniref:hypothetical protein n=1 Tax=Haloarchaeobius sp. DFWS5 TaxID=3446114 RepID=UPI003EBB21AB